MARLTSDDTLAFAGDFGYLFFRNSDTDRFLDRLEQLPFDIIFVDGIHENFPLIYQFPVEEWCGGKVHRIRRNIFHLMRGEIFTIQGHTFFVFGGASSIDCKLRKPGKNWWPEEIPNREEYRNAIENLNRRGAEVEYVLTHTAPTYIIQAMGYNTSPQSADAKLCGFLEWVAKDSPARNYRRWFFGHWHRDMNKLMAVRRKNLVSKRFRPLMFDTVDIPPAKRRFQLRSGL